MHTLIAQIITMAVEGCDRAAKALLSEMTPGDLSALRIAFHSLDEWLDEEILERLRQRDKDRIRAASRS